MTEPKKEYEKREIFYQELWEKQNRAANRISNLRLLISTGGTGAAVFLYLFYRHGAGIITFVLILGLFALLVRKHGQLNEQKKRTALLRQISAGDLNRLNGAWVGFPDQGGEFAEESHPYSSDLDIFGPKSLFQMINQTTTFCGRTELKNILAGSFGDLAQIKGRQQSIGELARKLDWRQKFRLEGILSSPALDNPDDLFRWARSEASSRPSGLTVFVRLSPALTILSLVLAFAFPGLVPYFLPLSLLTINGVILFLSQGRMRETFSVAHKYKDAIKIYQSLLSCFEEEQFAAPDLQNLQAGLRNHRNLTASGQISLLEKAVDLTYLRYHQLYFLFNLITLWDFHCLSALERWKSRSGKLLPNWVTTIGVLEALSSLAVIASDHPDWVRPEIAQGAPRLRAKNLAHPLLPATRVPNDLAISLPGEILLVTGSNMSGKSTLLRTVGVNLVLAYAGSPVCAREFYCTVMDIHTSMRINDSLVAGTSSFYAELLRIKRILAAAEKGNPVIFLLDEIFRGTNSRDRHTGAKFLLKKLSSTRAIGLVSTHDLELGDLAQENNSKIRNYHFAEYYQNNEILFDYKLRPGISTTRNALYLMKMAGIVEMDEGI